METIGLNRVTVKIWALCFSEMLPSTTALSVSDSNISIKQNL